MLMKIDRAYRDFACSAQEKLVNAYRDPLAKTPADAAALLVDQIGKDSACEIVSMMIVAKGKWDARISNVNREWADGVLNHDSDDLAVACIFYCDEIHPAHMDQIADAIREM